MNFSVINLGCKVNRAESDSIAAGLLEKGHNMVPSSQADVIIVNTCTVTGDAEKKTRKAVRRALRENDHAQVLVTGCAVAIDSNFYENLDARIRVVNKAELTSQSSALRIGDQFPLRVSVKVQDGCNHACTYCIVHVARGKAWSRPIDEILNEVKALEQAGIQEIVLSGIDLGSYHAGNISLAELLQSLLHSTSDVRFRISSIEPCSLNNCTIETIANSQGRICKHLHIPLQSGSSKVLAEMNRPYDRTYFINLIEKLYEAMPSLSISTDIIVGFPGETDLDFEETLSLAKRARFSKIHAFRYSARSGTPAAERPDQIHPELKEERLHALLKLADTLRLENAQARVGSVEEVLVEQPGIGITESYFKVDVPKDITPGTLLPLRLTEVNSSCIMKACMKK